MLTSHLEQGIAEQAIVALQKTLGDHLIAVVLFGSRARGEASLESDWDLLVIAKGLPEKPFERHLFLKRTLPSSCRGVISLLARTPEEFEVNLPPLYMDIALDGQIIYDPHMYAAERLGALRRLIEKMGLYRERTEAGDVWHWQKEPSGPWTLEWKRE
jgi:predicted nucleotidyltransferase